MPSLEPYRDSRLPERFLRWVETLRLRFQSIPGFTISDGSPEGVITGTLGDRYYNRTGSGDTVLWVKTTPTGNTGWKTYGELALSGLPLTAFGDLRTAELSPIFQVSFEYTVINTEVGAIELTGSGAVTQADGMCVVSTGVTLGSTAEWETVNNARYRAGLGGLFRGTAMFSAGVAGTEQMLGIADTEGVSSSHANGYGVGFSGVTFGFMRWQDDVLIHVAQDTWDDPMDGSGASGMTLNPTMLNVYFIEFQYLGAGSIKLWIESDVTGDMVLAHTVMYTNLNTVPSVFNPNFHLMLHVLNNAVAIGVAGLNG